MKVKRLPCPVRLSAENRAAVRLYELADDEEAEAEPLPLMTLTR